MRRHPQDATMHSIPRDSLYRADFVKGVPQGSYPFSGPSVSLFDLAAVSSSRPWHIRIAGARRSGQGWRVAPPRGSSLTAPSTTAHFCCGRDDTFEGSPRVVDELRPHACMRWARDPDHDAVMCIAKAGRARRDLSAHAPQVRRRTGKRCQDPRCGG